MRLRRDNTCYFNTHNNWRQLEGGLKCLPCRLDSPSPREVKEGAQGRNWTRSQGEGCLFAYISCTTQAYLSSKSMGGLGPTLSISNHENTPQANPGRQFLTFSGEEFPSTWTCLGLWQVEANCDDTDHPPVASTCTRTSSSTHIHNHTCTLAPAPHPHRHKIKNLNNVGTALSEALM